MLPGQEVGNVHGLTSSHDKHEVFQENLSPRLFLPTNYYFSILNRHF